MVNCNCRRPLDMLLVRVAVLLSAASAVLTASALVPKRSTPDMSSANSVSLGLRFLFEARAHKNKRYLSACARAACVAHRWSYVHTYVKHTCATWYLACDPCEAALPLPTGRAMRTKREHNNRASWHWSVCTEFLQTYATPERTSFLRCPGFISNLLFSSSTLSAEVHTSGHTSCEYGTVWVHPHWMLYWILDG